MNNSGPNLSSRVLLRNQKLKESLPLSKTLLKVRGCSTNKLNHARKMKKKVCIEDDAEAHEIDEIIPRQITRQHSVCSPCFQFF